MATLSPPPTLGTTLLFSFLSLRRRSVGRRPSFGCWVSGLSTLVPWLGGGLSGPSLHLLPAPPRPGSASLGRQLGSRCIHCPRAGHRQSPACGGGGQVPAMAGGGLEPSWVTLIAVDECPGGSPGTGGLIQRPQTGHESRAIFWPLSWSAALPCGSPGAETHLSWGRRRGPVS